MVNHLMPWIIVIYSIFTEDFTQRRKKHRVSGTNILFILDLSNMYTNYLNRIRVKMLVYIPLCLCVNLLSQHCQSSIPKKSGTPFGAPLSIIIVGNDYSSAITILIEVIARAVFFPVSLAWNIKASKRSSLVVVELFCTVRAADSRMLLKVPLVRDVPFQVLPAVGSHKA